MERGDADRLGRLHLSERGAKGHAFALVRGSPRADVLWKAPLGSGNHQEQKQNMSSPSPVTDGSHVYVMTGTGDPEGFRLQGPGTRGRATSSASTAVSASTGDTLRLHCCTRMRLFVRGAARHEDRRSVVRASDRQEHRARRSGRSSGRPMPCRSRRMRTRRPRSCRTDRKAEIVISGGDVVTGHDPATGKELWRLNGLNPHNDGAYRIVASPVVAAGLIIAPSRQNPSMAIRPGGRGDVTQSHKALAVFARSRRSYARQRRHARVHRHRQRGRLCARREDRRRCGDRADSSPAPTARRRFWPTAVSTSRTKMA